MTIVAQGLCKSYEGRPVLTEVNLRIDDGDFVSILAPTGEGKTTLLRLLCGIEAPDRGRILVDGVDVTGWPVQKRDVAMVYQWFVNYPSMTVRQNIASPLESRSPRPSKAEIARRVQEVAKLLRIDGHLDKLPSQLSGGQQQRLAIARALAKGARHIFLDEPLTNLDYKLQEELRAEFRALFAGRGKGAVILATPQPIEALNLSTRVGFLAQGRLVQYGPVAEVYRHPARVEVASYFSHPSMNILEAELVEHGAGRAFRLGGNLLMPCAETQTSLPLGPCRLGSRAHRLSLARPAGPSLPIEATVELTEVVGSDTELHLSCRDLRFVVWQQGVARHEPGSRVTAWLEPGSCFVFDCEGALLSASGVD